MSTTSKEHLIEQRILEYKSKLKHIDELIEHAENKVETKEQSSNEVKEELKMIKAMRDQLADDHQYFDNLSSSNWQSETIENAGPMAIWDVVAQKIEKFVERFESSKDR